MFDEAQSSIMTKKNILRYVNSFVFLPLITSIISVGQVSIPNITDIQTATVSALQQNISEESVLDNKQVMLSKQGEAIDAYFKSRNLPLAGYGKKMAEVAHDNDLDWRLIPAIAMRESTGGKYACQIKPNNPFGWGSCKIGFKTMDESIETIGRNLGGNNPRTAYHYEDKDVKGILNSYNPPSIVPQYASQVMKIMDTIGENNEA